MRGRGVKLLVLAMLVACGCASVPPCPTRPRPVDPQPFLWEVRGPRGAIILFGTHHAAGRDDVPAEALRLLDSAQLFVAEAPEGDQQDTYDSDRRWRAVLELPRGQSLQTQLTEDEFFDLKARLGMSGGSLSRMRPWVALSLLVKTVFVFPHPNMSQALYERAEQRHTRMEFLDTWALQMAFLDMTVGGNDLRGAIHHRNLACPIADGVARYRTGFEFLFVSKVTGPPSTSDAEATAISERSHVWTNKLRRYVDAGTRAFVAIGVANIVGSRGIAARLSEAGYTVTRLRSAIPRR